MGWLYMQSLGSHKTPKAYLDDQFTFTRAGGVTSKVLKSALCGMRTYYAAVEHMTAEGKREVFAVVCLVRYNLRDKEGYIFGYKDMDETMGPCERKCPAAILDLLTPTEAPYALAWRASCRKRLEKVMPKVGDTIVFEEPIMFSNGTKHASFLLVKPWHKGGHPRLMARSGHGECYRISGWKERNFKIKGKSDAKV